MKKNVSMLLGFRSQPGTHPDTWQSYWWIDAWRRGSWKSLGFHTRSSRTVPLRSEGLIFPGLNGFEPQQGRVEESEQGAGTEPYGLLWWHELLNILKLSYFPTAAIIPTSLYSLAFEVLRSDVVLVRKLGVPPLALDPTPYGADGATVALALAPDARCGLGCRLCAVHHALLCRPRQEGLFHSLKNGSGCQVWAPHYW